VDQIKWVCYLPLVLADIITKPVSQMQTNDMVIYAAIANKVLLHTDSRNLTLGYPFDSGNLVVVPIDGRLVTHFIG